MNEDFKRQLNHYQQRINNALEQHIGSFDSPYCDNNSSDYLHRLVDATNYCLLGGGKRIRPALVYASAQLFGSHTCDISLDQIACAVEMIHTYSLIHDDLPAMDDDELRRGRATCHHAFDEATAILTGDLLQARAFELLTDIGRCSANTRLALIKDLALASGQRGMVGGQAIDLFAVNKSIGIAQLQALHSLKTGALIRAAVAMGARYAGATNRQLKLLDDYARAIGLAFQVQDDILDVEGDTHTLGKSQGADQALNKPTYPALLGLDAAKEKAQQLHRKALTALQEFGNSADFLRYLSTYIVSRQH